MKIKIDNTNFNFKGRVDRATNITTNNHQFGLIYKQN